MGICYLDQGTFSEHFREHLGNFLGTFHAYILNFSLQLGHEHVITHADASKNELQNGTSIKNMEYFLFATQ